VTLAGRRREGKTTLALNLAVRLADPSYGDDFLGYEIPQPRRVLAYLLEDDATELQDRLKTMLGNRYHEISERLAIRTKDDFYPHSLKIDVTDKAFRDHVLRDIEQHEPDVVIFDNLAHLIGADYNNSTKMHELTKFQYAVSNAGNCAVMTAAHPRKQPQDARYKQVSRRTAMTFLMKSWVPAIS
jgi:RecA-family ATPase